ncbi:hypothetical protein GLYMA_02G292100v4 [Glycine max]|uniref:Uncharacterized protein n=1 Tax=Glycine max TaxID=3847 RepID=K7KBG4_SOYBN|nr:hypothetical protein JHK87_005578 [Glycine soja]KAG5064707.1 hypothetical protein JHK85_005890 [Glycine max]KRH73762.1 hypothetical protein GLYMA_02G292100v4 [Glycine max]
MAFIFRFPLVPKGLIVVRERASGSARCHQHNSFITATPNRGCKACVETSYQNLMSSPFPTLPEPPLSRSICCYSLYACSLWSITCIRSINNIHLLIKKIHYNNNNNN